LNTRLRYGLLFVIAVVPLIGVASIKPAPLVLAACLFAVHGVASLVARRQDRSTPRDVLSALLLFGCFEVSAMFLLTSLAMVVAPVVTSDGHHVMPIGQAFVGLAGGGMVGAVLTFVALRPRWRDRRLERLLLRAVGVLVVVAAGLAWARERRESLANTDRFMARMQELVDHPPEPVTRAALIR